MAGAALPLAQPGGEAAAAHKSRDDSAPAADPHPKQIQPTRRLLPRERLPLVLAYVSVLSQRGFPTSELFHFVRLNLASRIG